MVGGGGAVTCPVCGKRLSNKYNLRIHVRDKHEAGGARPTCSTCCRTFKNANSLRVHAIKQHGLLSTRRRLRSLYQPVTGALQDSPPLPPPPAPGPATTEAQAPANTPLYVDQSFLHQQQQQQQHAPHVYSCPAPAGYPAGRPAGPAFQDVSLSLHKGS